MESLVRSPKIKTMLFSALIVAASISGCGNQEKEPDSMDKINDQVQTLMEKMT